MVEQNSNLQKNVTGVSRK